MLLEKAYRLSVVYLIRLLVTRANNESEVRTKTGPGDLWKKAVEQRGRARPSNVVEILAGKLVFPVTSV